MGSLPSTLLGAAAVVALAPAGGPETTTLGVRPPTTASAAPVGPAPGCARAAELRARVPGLREAGRLDRALRAIVRANELCPAT
ncbi:MAG: hypothetical protein IT373_19305, partial [Polyangiaceae bacterium]|nr:hypothetical protein [Polyangiaceae bacterium]